MIKKRMPVNEDGTPLFPNEHWLSKMVAELTDQQIAMMFESICVYRKTGQLPDNSGEFRAFAKLVQWKVGSRELQLHMAEDALLFEMSRRYYENL